MENKKRTYEGERCKLHVRKFDEQEEKKKISRK